MTDQTDPPIPRLPDDAEEFVKIFQEGWARPKPDPFIDFWYPYISETVVSTQPLFPPAYGRDEFLDRFREVFSIISNMTGVVEAWAGNGNSVFIKGVFSGSMGDTPIEFTVCDYFVIEDGLIVKRESYFDPSSLAPSA